jgi:hypothetical protein
MFIDHITVAGADLEELRAQLSEVGFPTEYGGVHDNRITHMALAGFDDGSYLEIVAPLANNGRVALWSNYHLARKGGVAWTIATDDVSAEVARVHNLGIVATGPQMIRREKPDGQIGAWELAYLGDVQPGGILPFLIHDQTDRSVRVRPTAGTVGVFTGWSAVVLAVRDCQNAASQFQKVYGWPDPVQSEELFHFEGTSIYLSSQTDHIDEFGESPCACVLRPSSPAAAKRFRHSTGTNLHGKFVHWLNMPWKQVRIGVEEIS